MAFLRNKAFLNIPQRILRLIERSRRYALILHANYRGIPSRLSYGTITSKRTHKEARSAWSSPVFAILGSVLRVKKLSSVYSFDVRRVKRKISSRQGKDKTIRRCTVDLPSPHVNFKATSSCSSDFCIQASLYRCSNWDYYFKLLEMRTQMNLVRFFCCLLVVAVIGMTIIRAEPEPAARLSRWEEDVGSDIQLKRYADVVRNYYNMFGKSR